MEEIEKQQFDFNEAVHQLLSGNKNRKNGKISA